MQMSRTWIEDRIDTGFPAHKARIVRNYSRHVFLVAPEQALEHIRAFEMIVQMDAVKTRLRHKNMRYIMRSMRLRENLAKLI